MEEVTITSQAEYDALPADYIGIIRVKKNTSIGVRGSVLVEAYDSSNVIAYDSSIVTAYDSSHVTAYDRSIIKAYGSSMIYACNSATVTAFDKSIVKAYDKSIVRAYNSSAIITYDASVTAFDSSVIRSYNVSRVKALDSSVITAYDMSFVGAYGSSTITACGYSQVFDGGDDADIILKGFARQVMLPANIEEYSNWYNIPIIDGKIKLYKAVHKTEKDRYSSDYCPSFCYSIGVGYEQDCDKDRDTQCSYGLHVSNLEWAVNYGREWADAAILEVEVPADCIVVPRGTDGKIRTSKLKVLREVPRDEWR
jgi:hypothetical protein